jgi:hypothetical protein
LVDPAEAPPSRRKRRLPGGSAAFLVDDRGVDQADDRNDGGVSQHWSRAAGDGAPSARRHDHQISSQLVCESAKGSMP